jgi:hypothetical protein
MGTPVVLVSSAPGARRRSRSFASRAGVRVERQYLAFPSVATPAFLVEDEAAPVHFFLRSVLIAPPRTRLSGLFELGLPVLRAVAPRRSLCFLAPGRVVVGWRS